MIAENASLTFRLLCSKNRILCIGRIEPVIRQLGELLSEKILAKIVSFFWLISAHLNHIRTVAGIDYVGIGASYDGINA